MKKYVFELQAYKKITVEAENLDEAREIACFDPEYETLSTDYVSDGELLPE